MRTLAIILARGGSKRVPRKNIKNFLGKPVVAYSIKAALEADVFDEIMVSTDDDEIADIAQYYGASVPFMRSDENSSDVATTVDALLEVLQCYQRQGVVFDNICCIYPAAPLIAALKLRKAYKKLIAEKLDSVIPVCQFANPIQRALQINERNILEMSMPQFMNTRSQDLPEAFHDAGQFYWLNVKTLIKNKSLFTENTGAIVLPENEVQDIDTESNWELAELKFKLMNRDLISLRNR